MDRHNGNFGWKGTAQAHENIPSVSESFLIEVFETIYIVFSDSPDVLHGFCVFEGLQTEFVHHRSRVNLGAAIHGTSG